MYSKRLQALCGTIVAASASLLLLGCGTSNTNVRTVNASPGLTGYTVQVGQTGIASNLPYGTEGVQPKGQYTAVDASGNYREVAAGSNQKIIVYTTPGSTPLATSTQSLLKNSYYTVVTTGTAPTVALVTVADGATAPTGGGYALRIVQASNAAGAVDIYLTAQGGNIGGTPTVSNLQPGQVTQQYLQVAAGSGEIQVTPAGNPARVLYTGVFTPAAGAVYSGFFLDPPSTGSSTYGFLLVKDPVL